MFLQTGFCHVAVTDLLGSEEVSVTKVCVQYSGTEAAKRGEFFCAVHYHAVLCRTMFMYIALHRRMLGN